MRLTQSSKTLYTVFVFDVPTSSHPAETERLIRFKARRGVFVEERCLRDWSRLCSGDAGARWMGLLSMNRMELLVRGEYCLGFIFFAFLVGETRREEAGCNAGGDREIGALGDVLRPRLWCEARPGAILTGYTNNWTLFRKD